MKSFFLFVCALICASPALSQEQEKEVPKELAFSFGFSQKNETPVTSANIGYQRLIPDSKPVTFDETVTGEKGLIERETLSFFGEDGKVLGTLISTFDKGGHLDNQSLTEGGAPPRALTWFKTGSKSPLLTVKKSALTARYILQNGKLSERLLGLKLPQGRRGIKTRYDAFGRREHDLGTGSKTGSNKKPLDIQFIYDQNGLAKFRGISDSSDEPIEVTLSRDKSGRLAQMSAKNSGVLSNRATLLYNDKGKDDGIRTENFEDGILTKVLLMKGDTKTVIEDDYENGVLSSRKTQIAEGDSFRLVSLEEFDSNGKPLTRTDYDKDGAVSSVTNFKEDDTAGETRMFGQVQ